MSAQAIYDCIDDNFPTKWFKKLTRKGCHLNLLFTNEEEKAVGGNLGAVFATVTMERWTS